MLRLSTPGKTRFAQAPHLDVCFGGGEANVAVSLAGFGLEAAFVSRLPENDIADRCISELKGLGVDTSSIVRGGERMGIYYLESGSGARGSKVVYDRAHSAFSEIRPGMVDWRKVLDGAKWLHWSGITPAVSQGAADACLEAVKTASEMGIAVSCDLNYRKKLWKYGKAASEVMPELVSYCDLIMGNEEDAQMVFGIVPEGGFDAEKCGGIPDAARFGSVCRQLMQRFPRCRKVALTLRGSISADHNTWGGILFDGQTLFESRRYDITDIVDRVGSGDAFMGGLISSLLAGSGDQRALEFAAAASCLKHSIPGDYNRVSTSEVENLINGNASGRVSR